MEEVKVQANVTDFPWLVFKSKDNLFAINCESITSITILPDKITNIPQMPEYMRGVLNLRGSIIPLVDTCVLFGGKIGESNGLNLRYIEDHKRWIATLIESIDTGKPFTLAIDPHKCAFGIWYDHYKPSNNLLMHHLKKIDAPHKKLHATGAEVVKLMNEAETPKIKEKLQELKREVVEELQPVLIRLLEESAKMMSESIKEMIVVFENEDSKIGLIVDEVQSVEHLNFLSKNESDIKSSYGSGYVKGIGKSSKADDMILLVDEATIAHTFRQSNVEMEPHLTKKA